MKQLTFIAVLFFGGGIGFWLGGQGTGSSRDASHANQLVAQGEDNTLAVGRLTSIESRLETLNERVARIEEGGRKTGRPSLPEQRRHGRQAHSVKPEVGAGDSAQNIGQADEIKDIIVETLDDAESPLRAGLVDIVRGELETYRAERGEVRKAWREARDEERLEGFSEEAELTVEQKAGLEEILTEEREGVRALYQSARENYDFRGARAKHDNLKSASDDRIRELLDSEQFEQWMRRREERRRR